MEFFWFTHFSVEKGKYLTGRNLEVISFYVIVKSVCFPALSLNGLLSGGLPLCKHWQHLGLQCLIDYMHLLTGVTAPIHLTHNEHPPCLRLFSLLPFMCTLCVSMNWLPCKPSLLGLLTGSRLLSVCFCIHIQRCEQNPHVQINTFFSYLSIYII